MTWRLELALDKERILELYLNVAEWGNGVYRAEAAARHYFGKSAASLSRARPPGWRSCCRPAAAHPFFGHQ